MIDKENGIVEKTNQELQEIQSVLLDYLPDPIFVFSHEGRYLYVNRAFAEGVEKSFSQIIGKTIWEVFDREEAEKWIVTLQQVLQNGQEKVFEERIRRPDGDKYFITTITPIPDPGGKASKAICSSKDITERIQIELALRESEERYQMLVSQLKQGLVVDEVIYDDADKVVDYRFIYTNESFEKMMGLNREELLGRSLLEVFPKADRGCLKALGQVALTGESLLYESEYKECGRKYEINMFSPRQKQVAMLIMDITERKNLEKTLFEEKELLRITLMSVGDGVITTDRYGKINLINQVAAQLTGWKIEEALDKPFDEVFHLICDLKRKRCENVLAKVLKTGEPIELASEMILVSREGKEVPVENTVAPIKDEEGSVVGIVVIFRDFTERKRKQEKIEYLSFHDSLTGLYNRGFFEEELERLDVGRNLPLTMVVADVNGLKLTNDAFGHAAGDRLLQKAAEIFKKECRKDDIIARIGGDEFIILLPHTDSKQASGLVKRINESLARGKVEANGILAPLFLSISFGWDCKMVEEEDISVVFKRAEDYMYRRKLLESTSMRHEMIRRITQALNKNSEIEYNHSLRVSQLCEDIGRALGLNAEDIKELRVAGLLHDVGKIILPDRILNMSDDLTEEEWFEIRRHVESGYRILGSVSEFAPLAEYVLAHHERWDGLGYPKGLKGEEIPLQARIIALAESYDAMTGLQSYRKVLNEEEAVAEIVKNAGTQFDPQVARVFVEEVLRKPWNEPDYLQKMNR